MHPDNFQVVTFESDTGFVLYDVAKDDYESAEAEIFASRSECGILHTRIAQLEAALTAISKDNFLYKSTQIAIKALGSASIKETK